MRSLCYWSTKTEPKATVAMVSLSTQMHRGFHDESSSSSSSISSISLSPHFHHLRMSTCSFNPFTSRIYALYGDLAYPQSCYLLGGYRIAPPGSSRATYNTAMSSLCVVVEWGYKLIVENCSFWDMNNKHESI